MEQVTFTAAFFGGQGSLDINVGTSNISLTPQNPTTTLSLAEGTTVFIVSGFAPSSDHGSIRFDITGDVSPTYSATYPQGQIAPYPVMLFVMPELSIAGGTPLTTVMSIINKKTLNQFVKGLKLHLESQLLQPVVKTKKSSKTK